MCGTCGVEFISFSRLTIRQDSSGEVFGVAVWPHGRRSVRIETSGDAFTVTVDREGSMLIDQPGMDVITSKVFADMWPWDVQSWANTRGIAAKVTKYEAGWSLDVMEDSGTLERTWWRDLGRSAVDTGIERLTCEHSSPLWLPEDIWLTSYSMDTCYKM